MNYWPIALPGPRDPECSITQTSSFSSRHTSMKWLHDERGGQVAPAAFSGNKRQGVAEKSGSRTHQGRLTPPTGFEDRAPHQGAILFLLWCQIVIVDSLRAGPSLCQGRKHSLRRNPLPWTRYASAVTQTLLGNMTELGKSLCGPLRRLPNCRLVRYSHDRLWPERIARVASWLQSHVHCTDVSHRACPLAMCQCYHIIGIARGGCW